MEKQGNKKLETHVIKQPNKKRYEAIKDQGDEKKEIFARGASTLEPITREQIDWHTLLWNPSEGAFMEKVGGIKLTLVQGFYQAETNHGGLPRHPSLFPGCPDIEPPLIKVTEGAPNDLPSVEGCLYIP